MKFDFERVENIVEKRKKILSPALSHFHSMFSKKVIFSVSYSQDSGKGHISLTLYHTIPTFNDTEEVAFC